MSYVKEKIDNELLESWKQETKSLSSGIHGVWAVDKSNRSYLTFTGTDHEIPSDPSEFMCDRYLFLYQNNVYKIEVHIQNIENGKLAIYKAKTFKPKPSFDNEQLAEFSKNLDEAFTVFKSTGDIKLDMKTNELDCHIMID